MKYGGLRHVGRPPGVLNKKTLMAQQVLREAQEEVARGLVEMTKPMREGESCPLCGQGQPRPEETRIRASAEVMDRGGTPRVTQVENIEKPDTAWMEYLSDDQLDTLARWMEEARERMPINVVPDEEPVH